MSKDTPFKRNDAAEHDADVANREQGSIVPARAVPASSRLRPPDRAGCNDRRECISPVIDEGYLIPSTTRATLPPAFNFLFSAFFDCGAAPPSAASMFLTIATRRGPISLHQAVFREAECGRAAIEGIGTGSVVQLQRDADGMHIVLPFAGRNGEAMLAPPSRRSVRCRRASSASGCRNGRAARAATRRAHRGGSAQR